jgi:hypothetical protein
LIAFSGAPPRVIANVLTDRLPGHEPLLGARASAARR